VLFDQLDVISGDLVVIIFQLSKSLFMIFHQFIYMQVLSLLQLMNLYS